VIISIKTFSFINLENNYSICLKAEGFNQTECINTFNQYSYFGHIPSYFTSVIDFGVKNDVSTYIGHADSNWKTEYITGLNSFAKVGSTHYRWKPFSARIEKNYKESKELNITYFGELRIYDGSNSIFHDKNYQDIRQIEIEVSPGTIFFDYDYKPNDTERYKLTTVSGFNTIEQQNFATLRIKEDQNIFNIFNLYLVLILLLFFNSKQTLLFIKDKISNKRLRNSYIIFIFVNSAVYFFIDIPILISIGMSSLLIYLKNYRHDEIVFYQILITPLQILKVFDVGTYSFPRLPGTVPQHHQIMALFMNTPVSITSFLRGGDNIFYEPPMYRYILYVLNVLFGSNWLLVSYIFLFMILNLILKLFNSRISIIGNIVLFVVCLIFFSSGFLNLLLQGWSEPFFILLLIYSLFYIKKIRNINYQFLTLLCFAILIRPESILYIAAFFYCSTKLFELKTKRSFLALTILLLPLLHNLYFGNDFLLLSSAGNELGFIEILSNDGSIPISETLGKFNTNKLLGIFFYPFNLTSLSYVGRGFLLINLLFVVATFVNIIFNDNKILHILIATMSFAPYILYDIYDGYPRRALALTTACIVINFLISLKPNNIDSFQNSKLINSEKYKNIKDLSY